FKTGYQLTRDEFLALYRQLPAEDAGRLVDPVLLRDLAGSADWNSVRMTRLDDRLQLLFIDPYGQPLRDAQALLLSKEELMQGSRLNTNPLYTGRLLPGSLFTEALETMPTNLRLQVINDPQKWNDWRQRLICAAVSPAVRHGAVLIGLELTEGGRAVVEEAEASELAASYLVQAINTLNPDVHYAMPEKEESHE
ncbi:MAG TPA: hypothetical protein PLN61_15095, partial [bacterium]|nr:hypothetical protein [bacterium]